MHVLWNQEVTLELQDTSCIHHTLMLLRLGACPGCPHWDVQDTTKWKGKEKQDSVVPKQGSHTARLPVISTTTLVITGLKKAHGRDRDRDSCRHYILQYDFGVVWEGYW